MKKVLFVISLFVCIQLQAATNTFDSGHPFLVQSNIYAMSPGDTLIFNETNTYDITNIITLTNWGHIYFNTNLQYNDKVVDTGSDSTRGCFLVIGDAASNHVQHIDGFNVTGGSMPTTFSEGGLVMTYRANMFRLSNSKLHPDRSIAFVSRDSFGVVDHTDLSPKGSSFKQPARIWNEHFLGQGDYGDYSWACGPMYGTSNYMFFEDCVATNSSGTSGLGWDAYGGARYVIRHCIIDRMIIGGHGTETSQRWRGVRARIAHDNLILEHNDSEVGHNRSGSIVFFNNIVKDVTRLMAMKPYRLNTPTIPWGYADGTNHWDTNSTSNPYLTGTATAGSLGTLSDTTKTWVTDQWKGYSIHDLTKQKTQYILGNSATTISFDVNDNAAGTPLTAAAGDLYEINLVYTILDSPGRGIGALMSNSTPVIGGITQWPNQAAEACYCGSNLCINVGTTTFTDGGFVKQLISGREFVNGSLPFGYTEYVYPHDLVQPPGSSWYITTNGGTGTAGTIADPWSITYGLTNSNPKPGDTVYIRAGVYGIGTNQVYAVTGFAGTSSNAPIYIRNYPQERATINGGFSCAKDWITFMGLEVENLSTNRNTDSSTRPAGFFLTGVGDSVVNCIIHDVGPQGVFYSGSVQGSGAILYGNVVWGDGIFSTDVGWNNAPRGDGFYMQNTNGTRWVQDNITFKNYTIGLKSYTEQGRANNFAYDGNISFANALAEINATSAGDFPVTNLWVTNNIFYTRYRTETIRLGIFPRASSGLIHKNLQFNNNIVMAEPGNTFDFMLMPYFWDSMIITNNTLVSIVTNSSHASSQLFWDIVPTNSPTVTIDYNKYYGNGFSSLYDIWRYDSTRYLFSGIQSLGFDTHGQYLFTVPNTNIIILRTNRYQIGRANLAILNFLSNNTATVNISSIGLVSNQTFYLRDVQNYFGSSTITNVYNPSSPTIIVPLTNTAVTSIIGPVTNFTVNPNVHTPLIFNVFVIDPGASNPSPPTIVQQPASTNVYATQTALFTVLVSGVAPITYQWKTNGVNAGTNGPTLVVGPCPVAWNGMSVVCYISNSDGNTTSSTATLGVLPDPVITGQPANVTVGVGSTASFTVTATGQSGLSYQWSKNGSSIAGATHSNYTTPPTVAGDNNSQFSAMVTNNAGSLQSANATLTVTNIISPPDPVITAQPQSTNIYNNQAALFSLTAAGVTALAYQWRTNGVNAGTNGPVIALNPCPIIWSGMAVACVVSDLAGSVTSSIASLTISADPVITVQPQNVTVNTNNVATFSVTATGQTPRTFQWYRNGSTIGGATSSSYTTPLLTIANNGDTYFVDVTDTADTLRSSTATLTVLAKGTKGKATHFHVKNLLITH